MKELRQQTGNSRAAVKGEQYQLRNRRLKQLVADLALDKEMLQDVLRKKL